MGSNYWPVNELTLNGVSLAGPIVTKMAYWLGNVKLDNSVECVELKVLSVTWRIT